MKKTLLLLSFLSLGTLVHASFPINNMLIEMKDTLQVETMVEYHQRMESMGFDIALCKCEDCRKSNQVRDRDVSLSKNSFTSALLNFGLLLLAFLLIIVFILLYLIIKSLRDWWDDGAPFL